MSIGYNMSNLPPGCNSLPGDNDHDVSYSATITIHSSIDCDVAKGMTTHDLIDHSIRHVNQRYLGVIPNYSTFYIDEIIPHEYINFHFIATIEGDLCMDMSYVYEDDDDEVYSEIVEDIIDKLYNYKIYEDEIELNRNDIEYEVH